MGGGDYRSNTDWKVECRHDQAIVSITKKQNRISEIGCADLYIPK